MRYLILTIFVLFSFHAKGEVDGWKDFKFGMSKGEVKDQIIRYQKIINYVLKKGNTESFLVE